MSSSSSNSTLYYAFTVCHAAENSCRREDSSLLEQIRTDPFASLTMKPVMSSDLQVIRKRCGARIGRFMETYFQDQLEDIMEWNKNTPMDDIGIAQTTLELLHGMCRRKSDGNICLIHTHLLVNTKVLSELTAALPEWGELEVAHLECIILAASHENGNTTMKRVNPEGKEIQFDDDDEAESDCDSGDCEEEDDEEEEEEEEDDEEDEEEDEEEEENGEEEESSSSEEEKPKQKKRRT